MSTVEAAPILSEAEQIIDLTNTTFDRVQNHLDRYAQDPRRINRAGSLLLKSNQSVMYEPDHHYGFLELKVCNRAAEARVVNAMLNSSSFFRFFSLSDVAGPGQGHDITEREGWQFRGFMPRVEVVRERYPEGDLNYMLRRGGRESSRPWGERHRIGVSLLAFSEHESLPLRETHTKTRSLEHRFDKDEPLLSAQHEVTVSIRSEQDDTSHEYYLKGDKHRETPHAIQVREMQGFLELARDLRPMADSIDKHLRFSKFLANLATEAGFGSSVSTSTESD